MSTLRVDRVEDREGNPLWDSEEGILGNVTTSTGTQTVEVALDDRDAGLRQDLANSDMGAAMVARGVVSVDSIADLLALPEGQRKEWLRYLVKEYHAGTGVGGGELYWDASNTDASDEINVFTPNSAPVSGRFIRTEIEFITPERAGFFGAADSTQRMQACLDYLSSRGQGRLVLDGLYEIDRPLSVTKDVYNTHYSVVIEGSGTIKKSGSFVGDRLLTLNLDYHDEDNVIFRGITFDGVDRSVNLVDWWNESEPYDSEPIDMSNTDYAKAVRFDNVNFNRGYRGVRQGGNSNRFVSCTFRGNGCGVFSTAAANDISFVGCNFRRGGVGVHLKTAASSLGTVSTNFNNCIFESNAITGVALQNDPSDVNLVGCYWENNGFDLSSSSYVMGAMPTQPAHIFDFGSAWGSGITTIVGGHMWRSPTGVVDILSPDSLRRVSVTSNRLLGGIKATGGLSDIHLMSPDHSLSRIDFSDVTDVSGLIIGGKEYFLTSSGEALPLPEGDIYRISPGFTYVVVDNPGSYGMYEVTVNSGPNNSAVFVANKWADEVKSIVRFGISTGQPECFFEDDQLKVTGGTGSTSRVTVRRLISE